MRSVRILSLTAAIALLAATAGVSHGQHQHGVSATTPYQCGPPPPLVANTVPLWKGVAGTVSFPITTHGPQRDSVQAYFNAGMAWLFGYNFGEAVLSFRKAASFDDHCAMCFWGVATALGSNINEPIIAQRWKMASAHVDSSLRVAYDATRSEKHFIYAATVRFQPLPRNVDNLPAAQFRAIRAGMDSLYAEELRDIWQESGRSDLVAGTQFAEAELNLHPWDWWNNDGTPRWPATVEAVDGAREVLQRAPRYVGAAHIWIHALEGSHRPDLAYPQAVFLDSLMPGSAHLTHMSSHIFHRVGEYRRGVEHNQRATGMDLQYLNFRGWEWRYPMYYAHDNDFLWVSATFVGMRAAATTSADSLMKITSVPLLQCYSNAQHFVTAPGLVATRFGQWDRVLAIPSPYSTYPVAYPRAMWHYTRGWAYLRTGDPTRARASRDSLYKIAASVSPDSSVSNNSTQALLHVAGAVLSGEILAANHQYDAAVDSLRLAVRLQDALEYDEPPPFFYPARHSLGAVLLERGRPGDAAAADSVYRTDLGLTEGNQFLVNRNRQNGWAYRGMVNTMRAMGRDTTLWAAQFRRVWDANTPVPPGSRY